MRPAGPGDAETIALLMDELDHFYGASEVEPIERRAKQIRATLFRLPPPAYVLLAWEGSEPVGFATYSFLWPAVGITQSLYLKELYVMADYRRMGIGKLLMQQLCRVAVEHDCSRVEWTTDQDNAHAQAFYEQLGAPTQETKIFYRLEGEKLVQTAGA